MSDSETDILAPGTSVGRYVIVRHIGSGGMGAVYEARHADLEKRVALKTLHRGGAHSVEQVKRFQREGRAASRIRHPNVVDVSDVGAEGGMPFLVMEYLEGEDLAALIARKGTLAVERIVEILLPVIAAVSAAHAAGVVHRDLKPENIFLARGHGTDETPKVLDFGISKLAINPGGLALTNSSSILGTPLYMSPEQAQNSSRVDPRSDQYSLGVIAYECATGARPFQGSTIYELIHAMVLGDYVPPRALRPELPEAFEAVIVRAMHRTPENRFATLHALGAALLPFASARTQGQWERAFLVDAPPPARIDWAREPSDPDASTPPSATSAHEAPTVDARAALQPERTPRPPGGNTLAESVSEVDMRRVLGARSSRVWVVAGAVLLVGSVLAVGLTSGFRTAHSGAGAASGEQRREAPGVRREVVSGVPTTPVYMPTPPLERTTPVLAAGTPADAGTSVGTATHAPPPARSRNAGQRTPRRNSRYLVD